ncbi:hypothetical protein GIB67_041441 [Kingdonia uniflora]|uniref:Protein kinase domain-containing protein n=1 Tax=Kingdonia uniflora TaxID=39325 RepID=A0A7J7LRH0_9MAGN|nr:hypothetical protein GIB67_041441 [Kingdonia uniflora]
MDSENVGSQKLKNGQIVISEEQSMVDFQRASSSSKEWIEEIIYHIIGIALLLVFPAIGAHLASYYFEGLSMGMLFLYALGVTFVVFSLIGRRSRLMASEPVEITNGQTDISEGQSAMDSRRVSSFSEDQMQQWLEVIMIIAFAVIFVVIFAHLISYFYDGLSTGIPYLYAVGIVFMICYIIGVLDKNDMVLYKKYKHQLKIGSLLLISSILARTVIFYFYDTLFKCFLFLYTSGNTGVLFILYGFHTFLNKIVMLKAIYFDNGLSKSFLFLYACCITGFLFILCVFLFKKYNHQRKVARQPRLNGKFHIELEEATNNFRDKLGRGMSGSVFMGKLDDGTLIAVKTIEGQKFAKRVFDAEIEAIGSVDHAHLVCLRGSCSHMAETGETFFIVYDLFLKGSLDTWIFPKAGQNVGFLSWKQRYRVAIEVGKALGYLHHECSKKILHLDIKPDNILLDDDFRAVVSDFGLSKLMSKDISKVVTTIRRTAGYMAPEWELDKGISEKCDIFGYGKVLLDLFFGLHFVCLNNDGNDIYTKESEGRYSQEEQQTFHAFMREKLIQKKLVDLVDKRLISDEQVDENEVNSLVYAALWCLQEDPPKRPADIRHVVDILKERKVGDVVGNFTRVFSNKEHDNMRNVARFPREFRYKELEMVTNNFHDKLGRGGYGSVFKGVLIDGKVVFVERVELVIYGEQEFQVELASMASIQHAHIIRLRGYCSHMMETGYFALLVHDIYPNGSLDSWIFSRRDGGSSNWGFWYKVAKDVGKALEYLHGKGKLHLHIKPDCILLDDDFRAVVSDLGLSKLIKKDKSRLPTAIRLATWLLSGAWAKSQRNVMSLVMVCYF